MEFDKNLFAQEFKECQKREEITRSDMLFKIPLFLKRSESSLQIANFHKNPPKEPDRIYWSYWAITIAYYAMLYAAKAAILKKGYEVKTHEACEIALGHLLVPDELEKEDLTLLNDSHKIFEDEYVKYFHDARTESYTARYQARPSYTERKLNEILENAGKFVAKIVLMLERRKFD